MGQNMPTSYVQGKSTQDLKVKGQSHHEENIGPNNFLE